QRQFLLKFARDRQAWMAWLFEARKRFGLCVLDYMVTCNHIHLLVYDRQGRDVIPDSVQLVAGRSGQEYNQRKKRRGAYWEDRYHATAVETGEHLRQCLLYIDLNMVRAGAVAHPEQWPECGYVEIQHPKARWRMIDEDQLMELVGVNGRGALQQLCREQVEAALERGLEGRQSQWTESIAVGTPQYLAALERQLGVRAKGRAMQPVEGGYQLRETERVYQRLLSGEKAAPSLQNTFFWN
ncbi:MAG: transposase, partial [Acidobacteriota bacterium]